MSFQWILLYNDDSDDKTEAVAQRCYLKKFLI